MLVTSTCRFRFSRYGLAITFCQARLLLLLCSAHAACRQCSLSDRKGAEVVSIPPARPLPPCPQLVFAVATAASYHNACCQLHMFT